MAEESKDVRPPCPDCAGRLARLDCPQCGLCYVRAIPPEASLAEDGSLRFRCASCGLALAEVWYVVGSGRFPVIYGAAFWESWKESFPGWPAEYVPARLPPQGDAMVRVLNDEPGLVLGLPAARVEEMQTWVRERALEHFDEFKPGRDWTETNMGDWPRWGLDLLREDFERAFPEFRFWEHGAWLMQSHLHIAVYANLRPTNYSHEAFSPAPVPS